MLRENPKPLFPSSLSAPCLSRNEISVGLICICLILGESVEEGYAFFVSRKCSREALFLCL